MPEAFHVFRIRAQVGRRAGRAREAADQSGLFQPVEYGFFTGHRLLARVGGGDDASLLSSSRRSVVSCSADRALRLLSRWLNSRCDMAFAPY